jgi:hypothetical protein
VAKDHVKMFVEEYSPIAVQVSKQTGIAPSVLMAQWGMETDYGRKVQGHFNFGNIKDVSGGGKEAKDNQTGSVDKYVNFESPEAFGDYYAHMMRRLYPKALNTGDDISKYAQGLKEGVQGPYAEAENYEDAIRGAHKTTSEFYSGEQPAAAPADPFAGITSEAAKMKREEDERKKSAPPETPAVDEAAKEAERQIQGAVAGAAANAVLPSLTNPEMPEKVDISRIQERANEKADALELARRNFREQVGEFRPFDEIQRQHLANQQELERIKIAEREAQARLRGLPRTPEATTVEAPVAAEAPKGKGSGAVNWIHSMADEVPEVIANQATNMRADNPRGGQAIIDKDTLAREKQSALGASDWGLARTEGGTQFVLPPELVSERAAQEAQAASEQQAELERRAEETRQQQDAARVRAELERRIHEAELQELRNQRVQAGTAFNQSKAEVRTAAPLQRSLTTAQTANELAQQKLARAKTQPTSPLTRALEIRGVQSGTGSPVARTVAGGLTGYYGVMSLQEAMARAKAGDTSDEVIAALKAGAAATSLVPPAGKGLTRVRGAGSFGVGAGLAHELYKALSKNPDQPVQ